jgi:quinol monooxygenase YgiN
METINLIRINAEIKIDPAKRKDFENMTTELKKIVKEKEPSKVLEYVCYFRDHHSGEGIIIETYPDEEAFLAHLNLIQPVSAKYDLQIDVINFSISGALSDTTIQTFETIYGEKFVNYKWQLR